MVAQTASLAVGKFRRHFTPASGRRWLPFAGDGVEVFNPGSVTSYAIPTPGRCDSEPLPAHESMPDGTNGGEPGAVETRTPGSASGRGKRIGSNAAGRLIQRITERALPLPVGFRALSAGRIAGRAPPEPDQCVAPQEAANLGETGYPANAAFLPAANAAGVLI
jgi:hypothetical protein